MTVVLLSGWNRAPIRWTDTRQHEPERCEKSEKEKRQRGADSYAFEDYPCNQKHVHTDAESEGNHAAQEKRRRQLNEVVRNSTRSGLTVISRGRHHEAHRNGDEQESKVMKLLL